MSSAASIGRQGRLRMLRSPKTLHDRTTARCRARNSPLSSIYRSLPRSLGSCWPRGWPSRVTRTSAWRWESPSCSQSSSLPCRSSSAKLRLPIPAPGGKRRTIFCPPRSKPRQVRYRLERLAAGAAHSVGARACCNADRRHIRFGSLIRPRFRNTARVQSLAPPSPGPFRKFTPGQAAASARLSGNALAKT